MQNPNNVKASFDGKDLITLANKYGYEEFFQLYNIDGIYFIDTTPYGEGTVEHEVLTAELNRIKHEFNNPQYSQLPSLNRDCIQKVVQLRSTVINGCGEKFMKGTLMIVSSRNKKDKKVTIRPFRGSITVSEKDIDYIGSKADLGLHSTQ